MLPRAPPALKVRHALAIGQPTVAGGTTATKPSKFDRITLWINYCKIRKNMVADLSRVNLADLSLNDTLRINCSSVADSYTVPAKKVCTPLQIVEKDMNKVVHSVISTVAAALLVPTATAQTSVLTQDYDISRSGANLNEQLLTPSNVSSATFGKLYSYPVDEEIFAQPLYLPNLSIAGGTHNVVFVATMGNSVYAFDADNWATSTTPLWSVNLGAPVPTSRFLFKGGSGISHNGIFSTPVIDPSSNTIYVLTHLWTAASQAVSLQLHALDVTTGVEKFGGPVSLSATDFQPVLNLQRAGLLLVNGTVYVALGSHADNRVDPSTLKSTAYYGMVLAYDAQTLAQVATFNVETGGMGGSIWQGGRGMASDGTYVYTATGNAEKLGTADYAESFVQFNPQTLSVISQYQDPDSNCLNTLDLDLASSGPQVIPGTGTNLLVGGGKEGKVYVLELNQALNTQTPQYFWGTSNYPTLPAEGGTCSDTRGGSNGWLQSSDTAFWNNPNGTSYYYTFGNSDKLMSWQVAENAFTSTSVDVPPPNVSSNLLALSANSGTNGILWTAANTQAGTAILSAYNAVPSAGHLTLLWSSAQVPKRDALGQLVRYAVPTIANGKVYVGSGSNEVIVYGLLPATPSIQVTPAVGTLSFTALNTKSVDIYVNSIGGYTGAVSLTVTGLPSGMTYSFSRPSVTLTATKQSVVSSLSISPAGASLPLNDNYSVLVQASAAGGSTGYGPMRLLMRTAKYTSVTKVGCNSSNQMNASLSWQMNGSSAPALWIQDSTTPNFPGRLFMNLSGSSGTVQTGYTINKKASSYYWLVDQSAGAPATFDNSLNYWNMGSIYSCP
jgi:hypothetical protein